MSRHLVWAVPLVLASTIQPEPQRPTFRSNVTGVVVNVFVTADGKPVEGLTASDFELFDGGIREPVEAMPARDAALDLTLVLDVSADAVRYRDRFGEGLRQIARTARPDDRVRILVCDRTVRETRPLRAMADGDALVLAPRDPGTAAPYRAEIAQGLLDAVAQPAQSDRRQVVVALAAEFYSDVLSFRAIGSAARSTESVIYLASLPNGMILQPDYFGPLGQAAAATGGAMLLGGDIDSYHFDRGTLDFGGAEVVPFTDVRQAFTFILADVRRGYVLTYAPRAVPSTGWHDISVRVTRAGGKKFIVRARKGYFGG